MDLGPTRTDFNLGTPRLRSHLTPLQLITDSVILTIHTQLIKQSYLQNTKTNIVLHSFAAVHNLPNYFLKSLRVVTNYNSKHNPKHVSI